MPGGCTPNWRASSVSTVRTFISPKPGSSARRARRSSPLSASRQSALGVAAVALLEERAQRAHALGHRAGEAVQRRALAEHGGELLGVARRDARDVEVPEARAQLERARERLLDGDLLIEREADEERERVGGDQAVGLVVAGEGQALGSGCGASHVGRVPT